MFSENQLRISDNCQQNSKVTSGGFDFLYNFSFFFEKGTTPTKTWKLSIYSLFREKGKLKELGTETSESTTKVTIQL